MILPIITAISARSSNQVPTPHKGALAQAPPSGREMIRTLSCPSASPAHSGAMLGLGRALGSTLARHDPALDAQTRRHRGPFSIFNGGETFRLQIVTLNAGEVRQPAEDRAPTIAAGLVLFILTFIVNSIARVVINRWEGLLRNEHRDPWARSTRAKAVTLPDMGGKPSGRAIGTRRHGSSSGPPSSSLCVPLVWILVSTIPQGRPHDARLGGLVDAVPERHHRPTRGRRRRRTPSRAR